MKKVCALSFESPRETEHPLFRAAMQVVVSIEQGHPESVLKGCAERLRKEVEAIHYSKFSP